MTNYSYLDTDLSLPKYEVDYSKKITSADIDKSIVEKKFLLWDFVVAHDLLKEPKRVPGEPAEIYAKKLKLFKQAYALLEDRTIHLYATSKFNGKPVKLYYYQDIIINDKHRWVDVESSNQIGKSFELCADAKTAFLEDHGKTWTGGLISKSMPQNMSNMRIVKQLLSGSVVEYDPGMQDNMTVIIRNVYETLPDGTKTDKVLYTNTLVCAVATTSALGFPFDDLWLDEFEFWENPEGLAYMYDQVMEPRTFATKGRIRINSNPNGKNFVSEDLQQRTLADGTKQFHVYNFNFLDKPGNTREEYEQMKRSKHPIIFASTIDAKRTEGQGAALTDEDIKLTRDNELTRQGEYAGKGKQCVFFLDLGFVNDQSVLTGAFLSKNDKGETQVNGFYELYYPQMYPHTKLWGKEPGEYPSVPDVLKQYQFDGALPVFGLDITGKEGNEIHASDAGIPVVPVKMSGPWKATWYDRFISMIKQGRFKHVSVDNWVDGQNKNFEYQARTLIISTKMPDGRARPYPIYHHQTESDHDDVLDSYVGLLSLIDFELGESPGAAFFSHDNSKELLVPKNEKGEPLYVLTDKDIAEIDEVRKMQANLVKNSLDPTQQFGGGFW